MSCCWMKSVHFLIREFKTYHIGGVPLETNFRSFLQVQFTGWMQALTTQEASLDYDTRDVANNILGP
jgi:hypothetical protein